MMVVRTWVCPDCKDRVFSRATHDQRGCSCGSLFVDGGFEYARLGGKIENIKTECWNVPATKQELYDDWNKEVNKFGIITFESIKAGGKDSVCECKGERP